jgi:hypothetical protein
MGTAAERELATQHDGGSITGGTVDCWLKEFEPRNNKQEAVK